MPAVRPRGKDERKGVGNQFVIARSGGDEAIQPSDKLRAPSPVEGLDRHGLFCWPAERASR